MIDVAHIVSGSDDGYVLSNKKTGRFALYKINYITRELGEIVYGNDTNDITDYSLTKDGKAQGRPVGLIVDKAGALLVADDAGNKIWRVAAR